MAATGSVLDVAAPNGTLDFVIRLVKSFIITAVGVLGANLTGWTNLTALKAAGIAGAATVFTIALNAVLTWANSSTPAAT